ncbi:hypothetical protein HDV05_005335 [Chytridiales sp. JEL 0842]|nr:hypothetical protein HDV05_005335 [Chytridiales sp. JEL 0842]
MWKFDVLEYWIPVVLGPLFGQTFYTYYLHHVKMHHVADNGPSDLSSTVYFQRDNFLHFLYYFTRFYFLAWLDLPLYFLSHNQPHRALHSLLLESLSLLSLCTLTTHQPFPTLFTLLIPFHVSRFGMMTGNWAQHAFLEPSDPLGGGLKNSITILKCEYNRTAFNDAYHASHHLNALRHRTEHPVWFLREWGGYVKERAVVLEGVDYDAVFWMLMRGRYDLIAERWVHLGGEEGRMSKEEVVRMLKGKTKAFTKKELEVMYGKKKKNKIV